MTDVPPRDPKYPYRLWFRGYKTGWLVRRFKYRWTAELYRKFFYRGNRNYFVDGGK